MKALCIPSYNHMDIEEWHLPFIGYTTDILINEKAGGICGSVSLSIMELASVDIYPRIIGQEIPAKL
ncbi:MAG: hypothetical protein ABI813_01215 [Bacteroidota bacterium]